MSEVKRHNPVLEQRLLACLQAGDGAALRSLVDSLSVSERRTSGYLLSEKLLPRLEPEAFWTAFATLVPHEPKAYLMTFVKPACVLYEQGRIALDRPTLTAFAQTATQVDGRKLLASFLPIVRTVDEARFLLKNFCVDDAQARLAVLIHIDTVVASYLLFNELRSYDPTPEEMRHYCILLMQRGGRFGFNMASVLSHYFGVDSLPATFSLRLKTYQLSRLEESFESFSKEITKK
ncbi:MAG: hypothetical protein IJ553_01470 [Alloprevotella sp.]|nr:hypothetical protein [Alloprevotella sp.]